MGSGCGARAEVVPSSAGAACAPPRLPHAARRPRQGDVSQGEFVLQGPQEGPPSHTRPLHMQQCIWQGSHSKVARFQDKGTWVESMRGLFIKVLSPQV